jgi:hypothetical protein
VAEEMEFFADALPKNKGTLIHPGVVCVAIELAQDASDTALFGLMDAGIGERMLSHDDLREDEDVTSSSFCELIDCERNVKAFEDEIVKRLEEVEAAVDQRLHQITQRRVMLTGDSQVAVLALEIGSRNPRLQAICKRV